MFSFIKTFIKTTQVYGIKCMPTPEVKWTIKSTGCQYHVSCANTRHDSAWRSSHNSWLNWWISTARGCKFWRLIQQTFQQNVPSLPLNFETAELLYKRFGTWSRPYSEVLFNVFQVLPPPLKRVDRGELNILKVSLSFGILLKRAYKEKNQWRLRIFFSRPYLKWRTTTSMHFIR